MTKPIKRYIRFMADFSWLIEEVEGPSFQLGRMPLNIGLEPELARAILTDDVWADHVMVAGGGFEMKDQLVVMDTAQFYLSEETLQLWDLQ